MSMMLIVLLLVTSAKADENDKLFVDPEKSPLLAALPGQANTGRLAFQGKMEIDECRDTAASLIPDEFDPNDPLDAFAPVRVQLFECAEIAGHYRELMFLGIQMLANEQSTYPSDAWQRQSIQNVANLVAEEWAYFLMEEADLTLSHASIATWSTGRTLASLEKKIREQEL